ncbi:MAG: lipopolysaccharide biosynthesis protein [Bacteroidaceae bacterium]
MSIRKELTSGIAYTALAKYSGMIISLVVVGILARMLTPKDFGVVAIATVFILFFSTFSEMGIGPAIIQRNDLSKRDTSSIFMFTVWMGIGISTLFFFCAPLVGSFYRDPTLTTICKLLSINLLFSTLNIVPNGLIYKNKLFKYIAIRTLLVQLLTGAIAIISVFAGVGIYALIIHPILSASLIFFLNYYKYPQQIHLTLQKTALAKIAKYSTYQFMFNILNYFSKNVDKLIIGRTIDMTSLGFYDKSYQLLMLPLQNVSLVVGPVLHPVFSEMQKDKESIKRSYEKIIHILSFISFPLSIFLLFCAREIVLILFGDQWIQAIPVFQIFSLSVSILILLNTSGAIFQASNDTRSLFFSGVTSFTTSIIAICIGVFYFKSIKAIALLMDISFIIYFIQCYLTMYKVTFHASMKTFWEQLIHPIKVSILLAIVLFFTSTMINTFNIFVSFGIKATFALSTLLLYLHFSRELRLGQLIKKIKNKK